VNLILTHEADAVALLTDRYRQPRISALLAAWTAEVQALELAFWDLLTKRSPATAEGAVLDLLGKVVGQPRDGRTDEQYRLWIAARVLVNQSSGLAGQLIALAAKLCQVPIRIEDHYPAAFTLHAMGPIIGADGVEIAKLIVLAKAAGVQAFFHWYDTSRTFRFSVSGDSLFDSDRGFGRGRLSAISDGRAMGFLPVVPLSSGAGSIVVVL
jgi:hypothetical protein